MSPQRDPRFEAIIVKLMAYCKANGLTAHTKISGLSLMFQKRAPRYSRLTGERR